MKVFSHEDFYRVYTTDPAAATGRMEAVVAALDFDLHFGDGTVNILGNCSWVTIVNPEAASALRYLEETGQALGEAAFDMIGVSAGFDNHRDDWGGLLATEDYRELGRMVSEAARRNQGGCFGVLEGGLQPPCARRQRAGVSPGNGASAGIVYSGMPLPTGSKSDPIQHDRLSTDDRIG